MPKHLARNSKAGLFLEINSKTKYKMKKVSNSLFANYFPIATGMLAGFVLCYLCNLIF